MDSPHIQIYHAHELYWDTTPRKVSKYGVISGPYFPTFGLEVTPHLDTFHAVKHRASNKHLLLISTVPFHAQIAL